MKKTILAMVFFTVSLVLNAQTTQAFVEVKNVETRWESYKEGSSDRYGIMFSNRNNFPVTVEAELFRYIMFMGGVGSAVALNQVTNTKSFILDANEEYLWKLDLTRFERNRGASYIVNGNEFFEYVLFKAFKSQE